MDRINSLEDMHKYFGHNRHKDIYIDKRFYIDGTDYNNFIKLRYENINNNDIRNIYTINGWFILWYLMSNAIYTQYIETTLNIISEDTGIKPGEVRDILLYLQRTKTILCSKIKNIKYNDKISITIGYNNDNVHNPQNKGYIAIPVDIVKALLAKLKPSDWAIFTILCSMFSYFTVDSKINTETGEIFYFYRDNWFAFPSQEVIAEKLGIADKTVRLSLKKLEKNKIITTKQGQYYRYEDANGKLQTKRSNNKYIVKMMTRIEYIYHHIAKVPETRKEEIVNRIREYGFEEIAKTEYQHVLNNKDYIAFKCGDMIKGYDKIYAKQDTEKYSKLNKDVY